MLTLAIKCAPAKRDFPSQAHADLDARYRFRVYQDLFNDDQSYVIRGEVEGFFSYVRNNPYYRGPYGAENLTLRYSVGARDAEGWERAVYEAKRALVQRAFEMGAS